MKISAQRDHEGDDVDIMDILRSAGADAALQNLAKAYGITPQQLNAVIAQVVPALTNRIERNTLSRGGLADMLGELLRPEHSRALADPGTVATPAAQSAGIGALDVLSDADHRST